MRDALLKDYLTAASLDAAREHPAQFKQMTGWRCMDGKVCACG